MYIRVFFSSETIHWWQTRLLYISLSATVNKKRFHSSCHIRISWLLPIHRSISIFLPLQQQCYFADGSICATSSLDENLSWCGGRYLVAASSAADSWLLAYKLYCITSLTSLDVERRSHQLLIL